MNMELSELKERISEIELKLASVVQEEERRALIQEYKKLQHLAGKLELREKLEKELSEAEEIMATEEGEELINYLSEEKTRLEKQLKDIDEELKKLLVPEDPNDFKNALVEIRAGTGGEEAALFAADLFKMYTRYAENKKFKVYIVDSHPTPLGGFKEISFIVEGPYAYKYFKFESGVHRVQRIPITETGGRIHTSTASVVVLPEAEEAEVNINMEDLRIDTFRAGGPGGQYVNMTDSAVRITHIPTGIVVVCQDERSQHKNKAKALRLLRSKLKDLEEKKIEDEMRSKRKSYIGTGDRSEKIRTYNFPQNRVTDHRIDLSVYRLEDILNGDLDLLVQKLLEAEEKLKIESQGSL
ncbi:MAG TPA: peptide chain release factor 1 [Candidatus Hydrothermia bacterium]|nr:peptide chain release factor 1 [Candidatus Hydrothermia bacterium]MDD5572982.1 peptide chain release factor 1 [Candidatus Hydrothermia bacterium]HOK23574.1 peptide chain release factor 1 [Candidatus Hydrothermia bacterium]HOL24277.1 peptide chain release factor 1 [Candidatus Hydrothermia bacterium]HOP33129.1 peptide chain release factor 1 [Candidatus Hydrothermia bacterium]